MTFPNVPENKYPLTKNQSKLMRVIFPCNTRMLYLLMVVPIIIMSCGSNETPPIQNNISIHTASFDNNDDGVTFHLDSTDFTRIFRVTGETQKFITVLSGDSVTVTTYDGGAIGVIEVPATGNKVVWHQTSGDRVYCITDIGPAEKALIRIYPD
jgi:hypothetical protein